MSQYYRRPPRACSAALVAALLLMLTSKIGFAADPIVHQITLPTGMSWCDDTVINGLFTQINAYRSANGVAALKMDSLGMKDAEMRATQFAAYMVSNPPGSPGFNPHQGYDTTAASLGYSIVSENLAYMTSDPVYIVYSVWQDPLHKAAMLSTDANVSGVSCVYYNGVPYSTYEPGIGKSTSPSPVPDAEEAAFLTLINSYRAKSGAGPLQISPTLQAAAEWMSNDMATKNYASHTDSLGRSLGVRLAAFGYTYTPYGENLAGGWSDAQTALNQWVNACDPDASGTCTYAHRQNMLNTGYKAIGIARAYNAASAYGWYWTTDFGGYVDTATPPTPGPVPVISSFSATPARITAGQTVMLAWSVSGATKITIDNGIGDVSAQASRVISPAATTTYRLTASNATGSASASTAVTVTAVTKDVQPPTAPVLKSAVPRSSTRVDLTWTASTDNIGVTGYQVLRNGSPLKTVDASQLAYSDVTAAANTTYTYTVQSFDAAGNRSTVSNSLQATTPAAPPPPPSSCPGPAEGAFTGCYYNNTGLAGTPALVRTDKQINFDWMYASPDKAISNSGYSVQWQGNFQFESGTYVFTAMVSDGVRLYVDGTLIIDRWRDQPIYTYSKQQALSSGTHLIRMEYYELTGTPTAHLSWHLLTPAAPPPVISSFTATPAAITSGQTATLAWSVSGATSVSIDNAVGNVSGMTTKSVSPTRTTTYTLTAANSGGAKTAQTTITVTAGTASDIQAPTTPVLTSATAISATRVDLIWSASTDNVGVSGYQILRNGAPVASVAALSYSDTSVAANTTYTYTVRAFDAAHNYSPASNGRAVTTLAASSATCAPSTNAFTGCYYNNTDLAGSPVLIRNDVQINFDWMSAPPDKSLPITNYSVLWQGNFSFSQGDYTFYATASDGMRIYIDGVPILDRWRDQPIYSYIIRRTLSAGTHLVTVEYYERTMTPAARLSWIKN